ncbi:MAG: hypothetical protein GF401_00815 [Chitinivibrionales bacterium]|nr:hypothetical protein [Chitinivibrionales bacterium]
MICGNNFFTPALTVLLTACLVKATNEITSNDIYRLEGRNDTLWMITAKGINFTVVESDSLSWWGYKSNEMVLGEKYASLAFGGNQVFVPLAPKNLADPNSIWVYDLPSGDIASITIPWNNQWLTTLQDSLDSMEIYFQVYDCALPPVSPQRPRKLWAARWYGGLVEWDLSAQTGVVHIPGDPLPYAAESFPSKELKYYPDSTNAVAAITTTGHDDSLDIWVLTPGRIWKFEPAAADSFWTPLSDSIDDSTRTVKEFSGFYVHPKDSETVLFSDIITTPVSGDTTTTVSLYKYDFDRERWNLFLPESPNALTFGFDDTLYVVINNKILAYKDTFPADVVIPNTHFTTRLSADGAPPPSEINDILFVPQNSDTALFWIASNQGIYFSRNETYDEKNTIPFIHEFRSPAVAGGLSQTYFYPGILKPTLYGEDVPKGYFAYNLSKNATVTIKIYDWNMDLVKTVIDGAPRIKGASRKSGRSTVKHEDNWDGRNMAGDHVAPGVYYYKISSSEGERAFGKIVVAR